MASRRSISRPVQLAFVQATLAGSVVIGATIAVAIGKVSGDAFMALLSAITFYVLGHGGALSAADGALTRLERKVDETQSEVVRSAANHSPQ